GSSGRPALRRPTGQGLAGPGIGRTTPGDTGRRAGRESRSVPATERIALVAPLRPERARGHAVHSRPGTGRPLLRPSVPAARRPPACIGHPGRSVDRPAPATSVSGRCLYRFGKRSPHHHPEVDFMALNTQVAQRCHLMAFSRPGRRWCAAPEEGKVTPPRIFILPEVIAA